MKAHYSNCIGWSILHHKLRRAELIKWTNLTHKEIAYGLQTAGFTISLPSAAKLLKKHNYVKRKEKKKETIGINKNRDAQF